MLIFTPISSFTISKQMVSTQHIKIPSLYFTNSTSHSNWISFNYSDNLITPNVISNPLF